MTKERVTRILVIRLGALGDFILSAGPFAAIRAHHAHAHITLLTTQPFVPLAQSMPWFDEVQVDRRPKLFDLSGLLALRRQLQSGEYDFIYDLQTSSRSSWYFHLMGRPDHWSGIARGCSHPDSNPRRCHIHTLERQAEQLRLAGIPSVPPPDFTWVQAPIAHFGTQPPFALLCPGGAAHRPAKRWPAERFAELAAHLSCHNVQPVLIGAEAERAECAQIAKAVPSTLNLCGQTDLFQIAALAKWAKLAVGNDTGPMHLIAAAGCPALVLFSHESDPERCAPRGLPDHPARVIRVPDLRELAASQVIDAL